MGFASTEQAARRQLRVLPGEAWSYQRLAEQEIRKENLGKTPNAMQKEVNEAAQRAARKMAGESTADELTWEY